MTDYLESALFEHPYWLRILKEHSIFIHNALQATEEKYIQTAKDFANEFDMLLSESKEISNQNGIAFTKKAEGVTSELKDFKLIILEEILNDKIKIHLTPTTINRMINELQEYELIINCLKEGKKAPVFHELHYHLIWLPNLSLDATTIYHNLDETEKRLQKKSKTFAEDFERFYLKAVQYTGYLRAKVTSFPALEVLNEEVKTELHLFKNFLNEITEKKKLGKSHMTLSSLMVEHIIQEISYYYMKLIRENHVHAAYNQ